MITRVSRLFQPKPTLSEGEVNAGLRRMTWEGVVSMGFGSISTSGFLAAFALLLGANNLQIGILAALPFIAQPLQIPAILLVEKLRRRKLLAAGSWLAAQLLWVPVALIPVFAGVPGSAAVSLLIGLIAVRSLLSALTNVAWNSWVRDLVPQQILGRFYARRLMLSNLVAMAFGLAAALFVDAWKRGHADVSEQAFGYTLVMLAGALTLGLASPAFMSLMPEPLMQRPAGPARSLAAMLRLPLRDGNYRHLLRFQLSWGLALNLATPFFAVYMLTRLGLPLSAVIAFSVLAQASNAAFLRAWGPLADRAGSKVVLQLSASLYILVILGWVFTTLPGRYFLSVPLLVILHILAGAAAAGVNLTSGTIALKLAPQGEATPYLAVNSLAANLGAGLGPLLGGLFADFFSVRHLDLTFTWVDPSRAADLRALSLTGYDFLFGITFVLGLVALNGLTALREEGEVERGVVLEAMMASVRRSTHPMSTVPVMGVLSHFPFGFLQRTPVPGLDVAVGITAYQVADTARVTALAAASARQRTARIAAAVRGMAATAIAGGGAGADQLAELARHACRGAVHAVTDLGGDIGQMARRAIRGTVRGLEEAGASHPEAVIRGAAEGAIRGVIETGGDLAKAASGIVEAARQAAPEAGLNAQQAATQAGEGVVEAVAAGAPEAIRAVQDALERAGAESPGVRADRRA